MTVNGEDEFISVMDRGPNIYDLCKIINLLQKPLNAAVNILGIIVETKDSALQGPGADGISISTKRISLKRFEDIEGNYLR